MIAKSQASMSVEADCHKTFNLLAGCFDVQEPDGETWQRVMALCERLHEEAARARHYAKQTEIMQKIRESNPCGLPEQ